MKYSPKVQEHLTSRNPNLTEIHPLQPPLPCRGFWRFIIKWRAF
jgi:glycine cleavage system protein P-like pyridoxal-binding family